MIRSLLIGLLRIVFWVFLFYLVSTIFQTVVRAFARPRKPPGVGAPEAPSQERESPRDRTIEYKDVKDATFTEEPDDSKHASPLQ
ncbi:MAG: hypothetical protein WBD36_05990 [Bacteroidota bacterium]